MIWILMVVLVPFVVISAFVFVFTVQGLLRRAEWCPFYIKWIAYVWLVLGAPADVLFNWVWGSVIFREFPRELMFTARVKRHYYHGDGWRETKAAEWGELLNAVDPGHV